MVEYKLYRVHPKSYKKETFNISNLYSHTGVRAIHLLKEMYIKDYNYFFRHSLLGNAEDYLTIDPDTGEISVAHDDYFDFHRQNEFFVQVRCH